MNPQQRPLRDLLVAQQKPVVALAALLLANGLLFAAPALGLDPLAFPLPDRLDSGPARVVLLFFAYLWVVIALALGLKLLESAQVASWPSTRGVIVRSEAAFRTVARAQGMPEQRRVADIAYEFSLPGPGGKPRSYTGTRVDIAEAMAPQDVDPTLARYPVGREVVVHYDPAQPERAVLEPGSQELRKTLAGLFWLGIALACIALPVMALLGPAGRGPASPGAAQPLALLAALLALLALAAGAMAGKLWRENRQVAQWPSTTAQVQMATLESYHTSPDRAGQNSRRRTSGQTMFLPVVEYRYVVAGQPYCSRNIQLNLHTGMQEADARAVLARYPQGSLAEVRYDPADPSRAALQSGSGPAMSFGAAGAALLALATAVAWMAAR